VKEDLIFFSNGPGELSTWVLPVFEQVRARPDLKQRYRVFLIMHPCQFSSGTEHIVARGFDGVTAVIRPAEYLKILISGLGKGRYGFRGEGVMFSLGGDLMHPVLFRRRIRGKHRLFAYTHNVGWEKHYDRIFVRSEHVKNRLMEHGCAGEKLLIIGDLVQDSLKTLRGRTESRRILGAGADETLVSFLPGSRDFEVRYMLPVFLRVIDDLMDSRKDVRAVILKSPFVSDRLLEQALAIGGRIREMESISGTLSSLLETEGRSITLSSGKRIPVLEGGLELWGEGIDFAVTLPGTNTVQLAYRGIPSLVVSPLNKPELIPIEGVFGLLKWVPFVGKPVLKKAVLSYVHRLPFAALPNIYENEEIFPELFGVIETTDITGKLLKTLQRDEIARIRKKLGRFAPLRSPAGIIIDEVWGKKAESSS